MHNFFEAYEYSWNKLDNKAKEELVWFTCSVLPAVQKAWKPFAARTAHHRKYFEVVSGSDEAFGLFLLKNYKSLPMGTKKSSYMDAGTDDATEPELAGDKQDAIEDDDKDDDGRMETASETDAADAARSSKKTRKEKLSGMKLKEAMNDYQAWYQRLDELWDREDCSGEKLAREIEDYCISVVKKKAAERIVVTPISTLMDASVWLQRKLNILPNRKIVSNNPVIAILENKLTFLKIILNSFQSNTIPSTHETTLFYFGTIASQSNR